MDQRVRKVETAVTRKKESVPTLMSAEDAEELCLSARVMKPAWLKLPTPMTAKLVLVMRMTCQRSIQNA